MNIEHRIEELTERISCPISTHPVTMQELKILERHLDRVFSDLDIDIAFTRHFLDRVNDSRNGKQITVCELQAIFHDLYAKHGIKLSKSPEDIERVITSYSTRINIPIVVKYNSRKNSIELVGKTVMRKSDFRSPDPKLLVEERIADVLQEAFMSQDKKKKIVEIAKKVLSKYKVKATFSVSRGTLECNISSAPWDILADAPEGYRDGSKPLTHTSVNTHYPERFKGKSGKFLRELVDAMNHGNHDRSDITTDYFDVGHYIDILVGKWNKPFVVK